MFYLNYFYFVLFCLHFTNENVETTLNKRWDKREKKKVLQNLDIIKSTKMLKLFQSTNTYLKPLKKTATILCFEKRLNKREIKNKTNEKKKLNWVPTCHWLFYCNVNATSMIRWKKKQSQQTIYKKLTQKICSGT